MSLLLTVNYTSRQIKRLNNNGIKNGDLNQTRGELRETESSFFKLSTNDLRLPFIVFQILPHLKDLHECITKFVSIPFVSVRIQCLGYSVSNSHPVYKFEFQSTLRGWRIRNQFIITNNY